MIIPIYNLIIDNRAREWCKLPYLGHKHGCPNFNHKPICPPKIQLVHEIFNLNKPIWFAVQEFNLSDWVISMHNKHPNLSDRQCKCVLYWQPKLSAKLKEECIKEISQIPGTDFTMCPEAMGVNVIKTAQQHNIPIQPHPVSVVYKIAMIGYVNGN